MRKLTAFFCFLALCISLPAIGQNKAITKANKLYKAKDYHGSIPLFEEGLAIEDNLVAKTKLANAYKRINQLDMAEKIYSAIVYDDKVKAISFKDYGETLMGNGKYAAAKFWFEEYLKKKPGDVTTQQNLASCNKVYNIKPQFYNVDVNPFPHNSPFDDNGVVQWKDQLVFASDRASGLKILQQKVSDDGREFINVYQSSVGPEGWSAPTNFSNKINQLNKNVGPITFNASGDMAVFSRNADVVNKSDEFSLQLYSAVYDGKKWKDIEVLNFCKPGSNYMHPALSPDGKFLFFASDKGGGEGKTDIYVSERKSAAWSIPQNLGVTINSAESEGFPFYSADDKLYFCSKGRLGFGGFDIYVSTKDDNGTWAKPTNLGFPMNSSADDVSFYIDASNSHGFLSSSRQRTGDDIFVFEIKPEEEAIEETLSFTPKPKETVVEAAPVAVTAPEVVEVEAPEPKMAKEKVEAVVTEVVEDTPAVPTAAAKTEVVKEVIEKAPVVTKTMAETNEIVEEVVVAEVKKKKKKEMNTINKKSEEAITYVPKSDTTTITKAELEARRLAAEKNDAVVAEVETAVMPEASLSGNTSAPPELVEVSTSGAMANSTTQPSVAVEVEEEFALDTEIVETPKVDLPVESTVEKVAETAVKENEVAVDVETTSVAEVITEVVEEAPEVKKVKTKKAKNKKKAKHAKVKTKTEEVVAESDTKVEEVVATEQVALPVPASKVVPEVITSLSDDLKSGNTSSTYALEDLQYAFNATAITPSLGASLDALATLLEQNASTRIQLIGHTGSIGSDEKNQRLSVARAAAAVDYLIGKGVKPDRVTYDGRGETELLNECTDGILCSREQHSVNDRIEIRVLN